MHRTHYPRCRILVAIVLFWLCAACTLAAAAPAPAETPAFPPSLESYGDSGVTDVGAVLKGRALANPINLIATAIFLLAICHTFAAPRFLAYSHKFEQQILDLERLESKGELTPKQDRQLDWLRFKSILFHFLGEVEVVFGMWVLPLAAAIVLTHDWKTMVYYINGVNYTEPIFVFVIMAIASSKPILRFAESALGLIAGLGKGTPAAWFLSILIVGPALGSFITEPAAMTICALLLLNRFYKLRPSPKLAYATLGLLFVNISVGGTLTHFAAPPVVMVAGPWGWDTPYMLTHFGWKAVVGIIAATTLYFLIFRRELLAMKAPEIDRDRGEPRVPLGITLVHLLAIGWTVLNAHYPALVIGGLLFFLAFVVATDRHQYAIALRSPMLVGFFLAGLVIHGRLQQWWIGPVLGSLGEWPLMLGATALTAVNDNAAITYLATLVPGFTEELKYAVVAGAVTGGGLTVIANAPNPAGQSILSKQFGDGGVSPLGLFLGALPPTIIMGAAYMLLP